MLSRCKVLLFCMCLTAALTVVSGQIRGAELALLCPLGSTAAATGATCIPADHGCHFTHNPNASRTVDLQCAMPGHSPRYSVCRASGKFQPAVFALLGAHRLQW